jgi:acetyltransferase-like isoleucine patch superfamily enzyme
MSDNLIHLMIERQNANDDRYKLVERLVEDRSKVKANQSVAAFEGSKATFEVASSGEGFIHFLLEKGEALKPGETYAIIALSADWDRAAYIKKTASEEPTNNQHAILDKLTLKAKKTLEQYPNLDLSPLSQLDIVTVQDIETLAGKTKLSPHQTRNEEKKIVRSSHYNQHKGIKKIALLSGGRSAFQAIDVALSRSDVLITCYFDDDVQEDKLDGTIPYIGKLDLSLIDKKRHEGLFEAVAITTTKSATIRREIYEKLLTLNIPVATLIHTQAIVSPLAKIGNGNLIMAAAHVGAYSEIGDNNIISAHTNIEFCSTVGSHNIIGPGCMTAVGAHIGSTNMIGVGVSIGPDVSILDECIIGSGCTIIHDMSSKQFAKPPQ